MSRLHERHYGFIYRPLLVRRDSVPAAADGVRASLDCHQFPDRDKRGWSNTADFLQLVH